MKVIIEGEPKEIAQLIGSLMLPVVWKIPDGETIAEGLTEDIEKMLKHSKIEKRG